MKKNKDIWRIYDELIYLEVVFNAAIIKKI